MKIYSKLLITGLLAIGLTSCFEDPGTNLTYSGEGSNAFIALDAGEGQDLFTFLRANIGAELDAGFYVTASTSSEVSFSYTIEETSTAIEGLHYNVGATSMTIPADTYTVMLPITVLPDNIEAGEQWTLDITITSADVSINENYTTATHTIQISCPPNILDGVYLTSFPTSGEDPDGCETGFAYEDHEVTILVQDDGRYKISDADIGYFLGDYVVPTQFDNVCDVLTLYGDSGAPYGISFVGNGIFIPDGGAKGMGRVVFQCYYDATYAGPSGTETIAFDWDRPIEE